MVNIRENIFKQQIYVLISLCGCLPHSNNLLTLRLTMHNNISKVKLSIVNKHINNSFAIDKSHYNNLPRFVQTANKQYIFCNSISKVNWFQEITYVSSRNLEDCSFKVKFKVNLIYEIFQSKLFFFTLIFFFRIESEHTVATMFAINIIMNILVKLSNISISVSIVAIVFTI